MGCRPLRRRCPGLQEIDLRDEICPGERHLRSVWRVLFRNSMQPRGSSSILINMTFPAVSRRVFLSAGAVLVARAAEWRPSDAIQSLYNLDFDKAVSLLDKESAASGNPDVSNDLAYAILYRA